MVVCENVLISNRCHFAVVTVQLMTLPCIQRNGLAETGKGFGFEKKTNEKKH